MVTPSVRGAPSPASRFRPSSSPRRAAASVSLGYLSEIERGEKEASSEVLAMICDALDVPLSEALLLVSDRVAALESLVRLPIPAAAPVVSAA